MDLSFGLLDTFAGSPPNRGTRSDGPICPIWGRWQDGPEKRARADLDTWEMLVGSFKDLDLRSVHDALSAPCCGQELEYRAIRAISANIHKLNFQAVTKSAAGAASLHLQANPRTTAPLLCKSRGRLQKQPLCLFVSPLRLTVDPIP